MLLQRADPALFHPLSRHTPMSFAPPMRSVPGHHCISGHGRCSARHPCRNQPSKYVNGQKGEAKAAKSKNGHAGWNPGNARPVRYGANQSALRRALRFEKKQQAHSAMLTPLITITEGS